jgi:hypothetical protein
MADKCKIGQSYSTKLKKCVTTPRALRKYQKIRQYVSKRKAVKEIKKSKPRKLTIRKTASPMEKSRRRKKVKSIYNEKRIYCADC